MQNRKMGRRAFMREMSQYSLAGLTTFGGLAAMAGCGGEQDAEEIGAQPHRAIQAAQEAADPCNDLSVLTKDEMTTRTTFKYEKRAADETKRCEACNFWHPAPAGEFCGSCTLVKGPIHPLGSCMSWVEKVKT